MREKLILVYYIGIGNMTDTEAKDYITMISSKISSSTITGELLFIPISGTDSRIDCINPKYITEIELVTEHNEQMKKLNTELIKYIKNK